MKYKPINQFINHKTHAIQQTNITNNGNVQLEEKDLPIIIPY